MKDSIVEPVWNSLIMKREDEGEIGHGREADEWMGREG